MDPFLQVIKRGVEPCDPREPIIGGVFRRCTITSGSSGREFGRLELLEEDPRALAPRPLLLGLLLLGPQPVDGISGNGSSSCGSGCMGSCLSLSSSSGANVGGTATELPQLEEELGCSAIRVEGSGE